MGKKFYAVRQGKTTGIFEKWDSCKESVTGYPGAEYKSFPTKEEAEQYLGGNTSQAIQKETQKAEEDSNQAIAYVDGSFNNSTKEFSYGAVVFWKDQEYRFSDKFNDPELAQMHNVAGELVGAGRAMTFALENNISRMLIHHDYEGIAKWCTGEWKAKKDGTKAYKQFYEYIKQNVQIEFVKVKGHSGDKYNDLADQLAAEAMGKPVVSGIEFFKIPNQEIKTDIKASSVQVFIERGSVEGLISELGNQEWDGFEYERQSRSESIERYTVYIYGQKAVLDFYFKDEGPTTILPTSTNLHLSNRLTQLIEKSCVYKSAVATKTHSLNVGKDWTNKLVDFVRTLDGVRVDHTSYETPKHEHYQFTSAIGDKITLNAYASGKLVIQGKAAYLYSEVMSFLSYCPGISIEDILETNNKFQDVDVKPQDIRNELEMLMPAAYNAIDDTIIKILSPALVLKKIKIELEDYSCYTFPALRALEGYLKYLFATKQIDVDRSFGVFYDYNNTDGQHYLRSQYVTEVDDEKTQFAMEEVYNYFKKNRHTIFHTEQILFMTTLLEDRHEADQIVNEVIDMIERTYTGIINL